MVLLAIGVFIVFHVPHASAQPNWPGTTGVIGQCNGTGQTCVSCQGTAQVGCTSTVPNMWAQGTCTGGPPYTCMESHFDCGPQYVCATGLPNQLACWNGTICQ
jgi:hypothetical protein